MYEESSPIGWPRCISSYHFSIVIEKDHIGRLQSREVFRKRVRPEEMGVLGVANANVTRHAFGEAFAGKDAKCAGHVR